MELQFSKSSFAYLQRVAWEIKNEEQTQEVKLLDSLPDIGRVLGAWGQPIVRSKEWHDSSMGVSGGVMVWILYAPEEGGAPKCVETWIPFQLQWEFPQTQHDGTIRVDCLLKGVDARSVSARKMMVRTVVSVAGEALEQVQQELYQSEVVPEDVQLLRKQYPIRLAKEAGEKVITLDEEFSANCGPVRKVIRCSIQPEVTDQKIMADKLVFRGNAVVHMLCECEDEAITTCDFEIPYSQYAELEREYDPYATADVIPAVTNVELDILEDGKLRLKAGIVGQYVVYDRPVIEIVADAYSTKRTVLPKGQRLELPAVLDSWQEVIRVEAQQEQETEAVLDVTLTMSQPILSRMQAKTQIEIPGSFQFLRSDGAESLSGGNLRWTAESATMVDESASLLSRCHPKGKPNASGTAVVCEIQLDTTVTAVTDIPMVTALELGEMTEPDATRPSMILRYMGNDSLWEIAKASCSTVDTIKEANGITEEPTGNPMLLIPVL